MQQQVQTLARTAALDQWERLDHSGDTTSRPVVDGRVDGAQPGPGHGSANPILLIPGLFGGDKLTITATAGGPFEVFKRSGED